MTRKNIIRNIIPAIIVELMFLIYNLADTFFIAQTNDPLQVAAVSLASPAFIILVAFGLIFMIGGLSCISRALGADKKDYADSIASFCVFFGATAGLILALISITFMKQIVLAIGASPDTFEYAYEYLAIITSSSPIVVVALVCSGIMRAENHPTAAMLSQVLGNFVNIILDPIMILYLGLGTRGAAIATVFGHVTGAVFCLGYFISGRSSIKINIRHFKFTPEVFSIGIPACLDPLLMSISQMILFSLMSAYGDMAVAANGVAMRIQQIATIISMGAGQGVQPILGFCVGAKSYKEYKSVLYFALKFACSLSMVLIIICFTFAPNIAGIFLSEPESFKYTVNFVRILMTSSITFSIFFIVVNALQAMGAGRASFILSLCRQCFFYVPAMIILNYFYGAYGLICALPVAEVISLAQTFILYGKIIINPALLNKK